MARDSTVAAAAAAPKKKEYDYECDEQTLRGNTSVDITNPDEITESLINGQIRYFIEAYGKRGYYDENLWEDYCQEFEGWTKEIFDQSHRDARRDLRDFLRTNGVFVQKDRATIISTELVKVINQEEYHKWTKDEVNDQLAKWKKTPFNSNYAPDEMPIVPPVDVPDTPTTVNAKPANPTGNNLQQPNDQPQLPPNPPPNNPDEAQLAAQLAQEQNTMAAQRQELPNRQGAQPAPYPNPALLNMGQGFRQQPELLPPFGQQPPEQQFTQQPLYIPPPLSQLGNLAKMYKEDMQYSGGDDDLDLKLRIFEDNCNKVGLGIGSYDAAFSTMLKGTARDFYYDRISNRGYNFPAMVDRIREHFETDERRYQMLEQFNTTSLSSIMETNPSKTTLECFEMLVIELQKLQRGLSAPYRTDSLLRDRLVNATRGVTACSFASFKPSHNFESLCSDMRSSIATHMKLHPEEKGTFYGSNEPADSWYADRQYRGGSRFTQSNRSNQYKGRSNNGPPNKGRTTKRCFVCGSPGCWSTQHTQEERNRSMDTFKNRLKANKRPFNDHAIQTYMTNLEGIPDEHEIDQIDQMVNDFKFNEEEDGQPDYQYMTNLGQIGGYEAVSLLNENSVRHSITKAIPTDETFAVPGRYSPYHFQGIMIDTGAAKWSTAGQDQVQALQKIQNVTIDTKQAGLAKIIFGIGKTISIGTIDVKTPVGLIKFYVVGANTPFLLCLRDMDRLRVKFDNLENVLIQHDMKFPIVRKYGHPFLLLGGIEKNMVHISKTRIDEDCDTQWCHLTDSELQQLHRRFGHPSAWRLIKLLRRAGHTPDADIVKQLTKYCDTCQKHSKAPSRFKFTLRDDCDFNHSIYMDVMYLDGSPVLHVVDEATKFHAGRWLKSLSAKHAWEALRLCWIDVYVGPPDIITHDAGKNFASAEFRQNASAMSITCHEVPVEAHNSIGIVERYHGPLRRAYNCITNELKDIVDKDARLQMGIKAVNDTAGPDGIVPTLLVFGAYPRMTDLDPPAASITQRARAIKLAMKEVRDHYAKRDVRDALRMRNGPRTAWLRHLPLNAEVMVWRESKEWTGPHRFIGMHNEEVIVQLSSGPTKFRSTVVRPYFRKDNNTENEDPEGSNEPPEEEEQPEPEREQEVPAPPEGQLVKRGRGRPRKQDKQVNNQPSEPSDPPNARTTRNGIKFLAAAESHDTLFVELQDDSTDGTTDDPDTAGTPDTFYIDSLEGIEDEVFLSNKEMLDMELSKKLRAEGKITTPGRPFEESRKKEIDGLVEKKVFEFVPYDSKTMAGIRLFNSRLVDEVKGKSTDKPYEKSRLVIQAYNDTGKTEILTQSPTVQRSSQRLILALASSLPECELGLRDISQAYVQSTTKLNRVILAKPPKEIADTLPPNMVMKIIKPLYGIPEAGTHWFATYHKHHREKLHMNTSTYDPCLLITKKKGIFAILAIQTDDTLFLGNKLFIKLENDELRKANFLGKELDILTIIKSLLFNGGRIKRERDGITLIQRDQGDRIEPIDVKAPKFQEQYLEQRARGAYIATVCQPEAAFDLSIAAQHQDPSEEECKLLNKRLQWQKENVQRGIHFTPIDLSTAKLFVFVDGSFANNKDLSSQIGYCIVLANESTDMTAKEFTIHGNIIHWSSTKCKRVTRSVLASELYAMAQGVDIAMAISTTLNMVTEQLDLQSIPVVVCTDSFSLYECMVKLGTTNEKRLMIDIMSIRDDYEQRNIMEIRWINGNDNPADAMTKTNPTKALQTLLDTNELRVRAEGWVQRTEKEMEEKMRKELEVELERLYGSGHEA